MTISSTTIPGVTHHTATINDDDLHWVSAGSTGSPVLLVHGFPESWWAFHKLIPLLSKEHRVIAVDLPGFGDSGVGDHTSTTMADSLRELIVHLQLGAVHLTGQDISGIPTFRLAAGHPELLRSYTAIETTLPGYGMEALADVARGGMWHVGFLGAPGIPEMLLTGREREFLADFAFPAMNGTDGAITEQDINEFTRVLSRPGGLRGTAAFYGSMLREGAEVKAIVAEKKLAIPVLAIDGGEDSFTFATMTRVAEHVDAVRLADSGHLVAMEAPDELARELLTFYRGLDE